MQEMRVQSLGGEDPLEKEMATHSSILVCRIPWIEEPGGLESTRLQRVGHAWATKQLTTHGRQDEEGHWGLFFMGTNLNYEGPALTT